MLDRFRRVPFLPLLVSALLGAAAVPLTAAHAQLINGSFEDGNFTGTNPQGAPGATQLFIGATNITGWTVNNQELAWLGAGNPYGYVAADGVRSLDLSGYHDFAPFGGVSQTIITQPGATYNLSFKIGAFGGNTSSVNASADRTGQALSFTGSPANGAIQWGSVGFDFVADGDGTTLIALIGLSATQNFNLPLDDVTVTLVSAPATAAPEPATLGFVGMGVLSGVGAVVRRRCRRK